MSLEKILKGHIMSAIEALYGQKPDEKLINFQKTRKEIAGDLTLVTFPLLKISKKNPQQTAEEIGAYLQEKIEDISGFNVIKGFLNLEISDSYWLNFMKVNALKHNFAYKAKKIHSHPVLIEYSSPNTNKPLHLGHIRNNLLGYSVARILEAAGHNVVKTNLINDRGIHICKSMLAWLRWGKGETPESSGMKGDHLIGKYYVLFDKKYKEEIAGLMASGKTEDEAKNEAPLIVEAREMLRKWEAKEPEVIALWEKLNSWTYDGFDITYKRLGVSFDMVQHESQTYLGGKSLVEKGLEKGVLFRKEDGSVWADLTDEGLDEKLLLRSDGTSVYMTQDLGTAAERYENMQPEKMIYVVGNEQNYHFDVLKRVLKKLGMEWADIIYHLSYGMVELPHGKMKSREGTVVDADDLMDEMYATARKTGEELGKMENHESEEAKKLYEMVSIAALKYFILKVDPKKKMMFIPEESIDFNGNTGPFIQYTYARIQSLKRKSGIDLMQAEIKNPDSLLPKEKEILKQVYELPEILEAAAKGFSPALIANYSYELAKGFNQFYQEVPINKEEDENKRAFRLLLAHFAGDSLRSAMNLLGIEMPEKM